MIDKIICPGFLPFRVVGGYYNVHTVCGQYAFSAHPPLLQCINCPRPWAHNTYSTVMLYVYVAVSRRNYSVANFDRVAVFKSTVHISVKGGAHTCCDFYAARTSPALNRYCALNAVTQLKYMIE